MNVELILKFLKDLARHNNRDWFEAHKDRYLQAKHGFEEVVEKVLAELVKFDSRLDGLEPRKLPFRIYRDVRFSKDKRPYKVNMGAGFSPNGRLVQEPGYYLHLEPGNKSFVAGGMYQPDSTRLAAIRQEIDYNPGPLRKIFASRSFRKYFDDFDDWDRVKTAPKGYPKDHPDIDWLKNRSFTLSFALSDREVTDRRFVKTVAGICKAIKPVNDYLLEAIS